jgi:PST family polysaccharide transporter
MSSEPKKSYGQILKSSALVGGSSLLTNVFALVRTKGLALMLGPNGFGLFALYGSIVDLTRTVAGVGINTSGVRQIAEAVGTGDEKRLSSTVFTLRRVALVSGAIGALLLTVFCQPVAQMTFGTTQHSGAVALLALAAFLGDVSAGQGALIQGMRRIADLAKMNLFGAVYGTVFSLLIVYFLRNDWGVAWSLVCVAAMGILTSWWYARKVRIQPFGITLRQVKAEAAGLLKLGVVFMASALMTIGATYLIRVLIRSRMDMAAVGFYMAAWTWGGQYVGIILQAMGADFYPRLTAVANDNPECNRLVNEQSEVGFLLAGPGILGTLTLAPAVITLFYSTKFGPAADVLRWICLGMMLRVVTWPMGWIVLAKGARKVFFWTEVASNSLFVGLVWGGLRYFGLPGTGIAFFISSAINSVLVYFIVRRMSSFRWSAANRQLALLFLPLVAVVFAGWKLLPVVPAAILGLAVTVPAGFYSLKLLCKLVPWERLPGPARKIMRLLRIAPADSGAAPSSGTLPSKTEPQLVEKEIKS